MNREQALGLNRRLLDNIDQRRTDQAEGEMRAPAHIYYDTAQLELEKNALFRQVPQPVAFAAEIAAPGDYLAIEVLGIPLLLVRNMSGELQCFINACSHRGARVANGTGSARRLVCSFHGWSYDLNGGLVGRPEAACFGDLQQESGLTRLPVSEKCGIVVVGLVASLDQSIVDSALDEVASELASLELDKYSALERREFGVRANWKLVTELSLESYHFQCVHRDSVAAILESNAVVDTIGRHSRWAFPLKSIHRLRELDEADWPDTVEGSCTYTLYPGVMIIVNGSGAQMIRAEPTNDAAGSRVIYVGVARPGADLEEAAEAYAFGGEVFEKEDLPVASDCQSGITANRCAVVFGANEPLLQFWHGQWRDALS